MRSASGACSSSAYSSDRMPSASAQDAKVSPKATPATIHWTASHSAWHRPHGHLDDTIVNAHTIGNALHHGFYIRQAKGCDR